MSTSPRRQPGALLFALSMSRRPFRRLQTVSLYPRVGLFLNPHRLAFRRVSRTFALLRKPRSEVALLSIVRLAALIDGDKGSRVRCCHLIGRVVRFRRQNRRRQPLASPAPPGAALAGRTTLPDGFRCTHPTGQEERF